MNWSAPTKKIYEAGDIANFRKSIASYNLKESMRLIVDLVKGNEIPGNVMDGDLIQRQSGSKLKLPPPSASDTDVVKSEKVKRLLGMISEILNLIDVTPPLEGPRRFGNLACRDWHDKLVANADEYLYNFDSKIDPGFMLEVKSYLLNAFGSKTRLDYGTGHELSFVAFMGSLLRFNLLPDITGQELLIVFSKYYDLVRRLILVYSLEPAGSHGVWGLDDHFHFIYILGAAQFNNPKSKIYPPVQSVLNPTVIEEYCLTNLYINALAFIYKIKSGPFNEHSPIIFDIHNTVSLWKKVLSGLLKMYDVEVLGKFPVVQHFWFGEVLYPWKDNLTKIDLPVHDTSGKNDGFLNHDKGIKTTNSTVSMTGAPWARNTPRR